MEIPIASTSLGVVPTAQVVALRLVRLLVWNGVSAPTFIDVLCRDVAVAFVRTSIDAGSVGVIWVLPPQLNLELATRIAFFPAAGIPVECRTI